MMRDRKRILFAATTSRYIYDHLLPFIVMMEREGYEVDILSDVDSTSPYLAEHPSIKRVYKLKMCRHMLHPSNVIACRKIREHLKINQYAIIHTHTPMASFLLSIAGKHLKNTKIISIAENLTPYPHITLQDRFRTHIPHRIAARHASTLVTTNMQDFDYAKSKFKSRQVHYIPGLGLDLRQDMERPMDKHFRKVILCVHDFRKYKNHDIMLKAIPIILSQLDDAEVWFVGKGKTHESCIKLSKEMGINKNIEWMGLRNDLSNLLCQSDMVVFTASTHELSPIVIHAMACGKPVVALDHVRNHELVNDGQNGYLVPPDDPEALAKACIKVLGHKSVTQMCDSSRFMARKFDVTHVKNLMHTIYKNC